MEVKPGYKQTEVGVIPEEWDAAKLSEACSMKSGEGITSANIDEYSKYPCFGGNGLRGFAKRFTHDGSYALIGRQGALCGNVLGVAGKFFASEHAIVVTALARTDIRWLTLVLGRMELNQYSESSAQPGLSVSKLLYLPIPLPPLPEQRTIAEALSDVDALMGGLDRLIAKKRDLKQAAMQQLLTGQKRLPGFQGEWEVKRLGELFEITSSKRVFQSEWKSEGIPFYRARELAVLGETGRLDNELFITKSLYESFRTAHGVPEVGDMLVTGVGTLGKVYVVRDEQEFYFKDGNIIWFKIRGKVSAEFLRQLYLTKVVMKQITDASAGTTVGTYTISGAKKTEIPFPPLPEQTAIAEVLSDMDAELVALEQRREKTRALKQGMMQELLTGRTRLV
jgi:type I restriction enzyme S subunit